MVYTCLGVRGLGRVGVPSGTLWKPPKPIGTDIFRFGTVLRNSISYKFGYKSTCSPYILLYFPIKNKVSKRRIRFFNSHEHGDAGGIIFIDFGENYK